MRAPHSSNRTDNSLFDCIEPWKRVQEEKEKGNLKESCLLSSEVTLSGFKPETF
jgi:hypothetical protein